MFFNGKLDAIDLMAIEQEERKKDLERIVRFIKLRYSCGAIDIDDVAAECGIYNLTPAEADYIERRINER